jgi:F420H(2)-dependent quinone reductase
MQRLLARATHRSARVRPLGRVFGRLHSTLVKRSGGRVGGSWLGAPVVILVTTGRRTGRVRETPLLYVKVDDRSIALLGANAGNDRIPAWWHNLTAAPTADTIIKGRRTTMTWREATPDEHRSLFAAFVAAYPPAGHYPTFTDRHLPIAILTPVA